MKKIQEGSDLKREQIEFLDMEPLPLSSPKCGAFFMDHISETGIRMQRMSSSGRQGAQAIRTG